MSYLRKREISHQANLNRPRRHKQQGVVIVVALFIVALVATMAYVMMARLERDTRRTQLLLRDTQAEFYAQASVFWAVDFLRQNIENKKPNTLIDILPVTSPENNENGYKIKSTIYDMQARFNLNNLNQVTGMAAFERLIKAVKPDLNEEQTKEVVRGVVEWVTVGQQGGTNQYYMELAVPYRAAHRPMFHASELRLVKGISPALYLALEPYVTALPPEAPMNVQSASAPVLMTLSSTMTLDAANAIVDLRKKKPFVTLESFKQADIVKNHLAKDDKGENLTVTSGFFLVETHVSIENQALVFYTLLERAVSGDKAKVTVLWQSKGAM